MRPLCFSKEDYRMKFSIVHENAGRMRIHLAVQRMTMEQADKMEAWLERQENVTAVTVHDNTCCAIIRYQGERQELIRQISGFSFQSAEVTALENVHSNRALNREYQEKLVSMTCWRVLRKLFLPAPLRAVYTAWRSLPYIGRALRCIWHRKMAVELLDGVSIGISVFRGDFDTAGSVMFLLKLGELLEEWTHKKSMGDLARSMSLNIDRVWKKTEGGEELVPLNQVRTGDLVCVRVGGMIPLDGEVTEGEAMVNQASLTGESIPVAKRPGSTVYAGTVVEEGECVFCVKAQNGGSRYDKIVSMIEQSERLKSSAESKASNLADRLVPYTLLTSGLVWLLTRNTTRALSVLMVDFSCALKLSMPLAVLSAMREASHYHMTVKGGKFLERVAKADTIVFDKTGTLTHASPVVDRVVPFGGRSATEMLRLAACLEEHFPHSMANAVVQAARDRGLNHEEMHSQVEYLVAHGIASAVEGQRVIIGSAHFVFEDEHVAVPEGEQAVFDALPPQFSHLYLAIGGELAAVICIADPLRSEAVEVVRALRELGVSKLVMLTGDSERTAAAIAAQVGVDEYRSEVLPEDKANFVEEERAKGRTVVMLGDGINDSPALSAADVGIAVSDGAAIAREIADITVSSEDLRELIRLRRLSCELMKRIHANYRFVLGFNGTLIGLGAFGILPPATSALLHNASTLGISLHSMTNLLEKTNH